MPAFCADGRFKVVRSASYGYAKRNNCRKGHKCKKPGWSINYKMTDWCRHPRGKGTKRGKRVLTVTPTQAANIISQTAGVSPLKAKAIVDRAKQLRNRTRNPVARAMATMIKNKKKYPTSRMTLRPRKPRKLLS